MILQDYSLKDEWVKHRLEERIKVVKHLYYWQYSNRNSFTDILFNLFHKADPTNLSKLRVGFKLEYLCYLQWKNAGDNGNDLFREYGLVK